MIVPIDDAEMNEIRHSLKVFTIAMPSVFVALINKSRESNLKELKHISNTQKKKYSIYFLISLRIATFQNK